MAEIALKEQEKLEAYCQRYNVSGLIEELVSKCPALSELVLEAFYRQNPS